jgi:hypothetical protein
MSDQFGIIHGEPIAQYHANPAVSSTQLMDMRPCPAYYYGRHITKTIPPPKSDAFDVGNGAHWLIVEGRKALEERTVLQPAEYHAWSNHKEPRDLGMKPWNWNATVCEEWGAREARGRVVLTADDFAKIDRMAEAVAENPDAVVLLSGGESEVTFRVQHPAFAVQCRADMWHAKGVSLDEAIELAPLCVDLKTCDTIEQFRAHYFKHRYYYRAAFYQDVIGDCLGVAGERPAFLFVVVEKFAPWRCEVFEPSEADLELGRNEVLADLKLLRGCIESGIWPNSTLGVQSIELTAWQRKIAEANGAAIFEETLG